MFPKSVRFHVKGKYTMSTMLGNTETSLRKTYIMAKLDRRKVLRLIQRAKELGCSSSVIHCNNFRLYFKIGNLNFCQAKFNSYFSFLAALANNLSSEILSI